MPDRLTQLIALVVLAAGVLGAFMLTPVLNRQRVERQLTYDVEVGDNANPAYLLGAAMGSFRGVAVNVLWQRAEALKQEGKFFESNNLAEMITTLQPRYPRAWDIQAWNMAYNISVKCKTFEERWDWVQKGLNLLRDRGIPNNPNAVVLYRSMAQILNHKMAGQTDDAHWYYKARIAEQWQTLLGAPNPDWVLKPEFTGENRPPAEELNPLEHGRWLATVRFGEIADTAERYFRKPGRAVGDYNTANYFTTLSPDKLRAFYDENPGVERFVRELEALTGEDGEPLGLGLNTRTLRAIGRWQMFRAAGYSTTIPAVNNAETLGVDAMAFQELLFERAKTTEVNLNPMVDIEALRQRASEAAPGVEVLDLVPMLDLLRARAIIADYHMDPGYMLHCMERFGPLDWRHPSAHAVYWTALGTLRAEQWTRDKERVDFINANRDTIHALQQLAHNGKITFRPRVEGMGPYSQDTINHAPDTRMIPAYARAWDDTMEKLERGDFGEGHDPETYKRGYENFLHAAVYLYYFEGNELRARLYFDKVKALFGEDPMSTSVQDGEYNLSLADFARVRREDDLGFQEVALVQFWIRRAWERGLAERSQAVMMRHLDAAQQTYDEFLEERDTTTKNDNQGTLGRQDIPDFERFVLDGFLELMGQTRYSLPQKAGIWQLAGPLLSRRQVVQALPSGREQAVPLHFLAYSQVRQLAGAQAQLEGWSEQDLDGLFEQPPGYREWYLQNIRQDAPAPVRPQ